MFTPTRFWPLGFDRTNWPRFALGVVLIFVVLGLLDAPVTAFVSSLPGNARAPFYVITRAGNSDWILIPTLLATVLAFGAGRLALNGNARRKALTAASVALFAFAGVAVPGIVSSIVKRLVGRARPTHFPELGTLHFEPIRDWGYQSFPSGDTTTIFALAGVIMVLMPRTRCWVLAGAMLVGLSRIMVGVHFPTDVFGGLLLGLFGAFGVRNFCLVRGWLFIRRADGAVVPRLDWPGKGQAEAAR